MNLLSGTVLGLAALVASPALWAAFVDGTMPIDVALVRYLIAVVGCWLALSVLASLIGTTPPPSRPEESEEPTSGLSVDG